MVMHSELHEQCRICSWQGPREDSFVIDKAPELVNELPMAGSRPGERTRRLSLWECPACGHMQLRERCAPATWKAAVTAAGLSAEMRRERQALFSRMRSMCKNSSILEIGSSEGLFLPLLAEAGFDPKGLEWSDELVAKGRAKGLKLIQGHVLDGALNGLVVENFASINFLEHATRPSEMLLNIAQSCAPGAIGLVEVPNFEKDIATERSHDLVAEHLSYFTPRTLRLCLESSGFDILSMETFWHGDDIIAWVTPRQPRALSDWSLRDPALNLMGSFIGQASLGKLALWGASHQALTLLSMLDASLARQFMTIADSSPRKQGRMDPAWGVPIVSPQHMLELAPTHVLIMAAGFSTEVASQLRSMGYQGKAAILADGELREVQG